MLNEVQTKVEKCKLQLYQQPSLTITLITSLIIFNIYTDVHKIHSKRRFFFWFLNAFKSSCTFRAIRKKEYLYINKKRMFSWSICVCSPVVYELVANQVHPRTSNRRVWLIWWHSLSQFHFSHFSQHQ